MPLILAFNTNDDQTLWLSTAHGQSLTKIPPIISHIAMGHPP
jgi:hypothetical protein